VIRSIRGGSANACAGLQIFAVHLGVPFQDRIAQDKDLWPQVPADMRTTTHLSSNWPVAARALPVNCPLDNPHEQLRDTLEIAMQATSSVSAQIGLAEIFPTEAIIIGLVQRTKRGVVEELVQRSVELGYLGSGDATAVVESVLAREKMGSTALGSGIAVPHCRSSFTERFVGILGVEPCGIPFDAVDGEPVQSIFLLLAPLDGRERHYEVLGRITAIGRDKGRCMQLRGCRSSVAVHHFLQELDRC